MGGLRKMMPITFAAMLVCTLAIAGMPLAGYYSKDRIIGSAIESVLTQWRGGNVFVMVVLPLAAMLTTFYMFRLIFMTFFGEYRGGHDDHGHGHGHDDHAAHDAHDDHGHGHVPHESPTNMAIPLIVLGLLGVFGGHMWLTGDPLSNNGTWFTNLVRWEDMYVLPNGSSLQLLNMNMLEVSEHNHHVGHLWAVGVSLTVLALGLFGAWWMYIRKADPSKQGSDDLPGLFPIPDGITGKLGLVYETVRDKYYIDEFVNGSVIRGTMVAARAQSWFDANVVDGLVVGTGKTARALGFVCGWIDKHIVDGAELGREHHPGLRLRGAPVPDRPHPAVHLVRRGGRPCGGLPHPDLIPPASPTDTSRQIAMDQLNLDSANATSLLSGDLLAADRHDGRHAHPEDEHARDQDRGRRVHLHPAGMHQMYSRASTRRLGAAVRRAPQLDPDREDLLLGRSGWALLTPHQVTTILFFIAVPASETVPRLSKAYYALFLMLEVGVIGVFVALDYFLFYVYWEIMLLPMYFLIGIWGGPQREYAAIKFFLYTLAGSVLMLIAVVAMRIDTGTFSIPELIAIGKAGGFTGPALLGMKFTTWVFWFLFVAFAIKIPAFPFTRGCRTPTSRRPPRSP